MPSFITTACATEDTNFFKVGNYSASSYTTSWTTRTTPDVEGPGFSTPVYLQVLQKFGIPTDGSGPSTGILPGIDIKSMPALDAIRFSLSEAMINGEWWDMYEDGHGGVRFAQVFGPDVEEVSLDIRLCIPSSNKANLVDMVIVHGYDPPPERFLGAFKDIVPAGTGEINPQEVRGDELLFTIAPGEFLDDCLASQLAAKEVFKSYPDPLVEESVFGSQVQNPFYAPAAFESLVTHFVRITGMPESPDEAARVKYEFQPVTPWYKQIDLPTFTRKSKPDACPSFPGAPGISYFEGVFDLITNDYTDRYGTRSPLVLRPNNIFTVANKAYQIIQGFSGTEAGVNGGQVGVYVDPSPEFLRLSPGQNWTYSIEGINHYSFHIYYQPAFDPDAWEVILDSMVGLPTQVFYSDGSNFSQTRAAGYSGGTFSQLGFLGISGGLGYVTQKSYIELSLDRPCVAITDADGDSLSFAADFKMEFAPVILRDRPHPTAYVVNGGSPVVVDYSEALPDVDPTTCQNFEETSEQIMQDLMQGNVLELTLPFCKDADDCSSIAATVYNYMHNDGIQTYTLTCGPNDQPKLGARVAGFDANLRIESIEYSYSDASSYTINVTLGPIFTNIGSFNGTAWQRRREDISRKATVIWTAGDGANYRVQVRGMGTYYAVNAAQDIWRVGEHVDVTIVNVPVEI